ncbi:MAG: hypothetical protein JW925_05590 [Syntrophaceae bacterium]|nr:hypothetical protein [Syntrophaceae bacterium]
MNLFAEIVVSASSAFLIGLAGVVFFKPAMTKRFILSFASSARAHYIEMFFRLLFGASLVLHSRTMWQANLFLILGWAIIISSVALLVMPWQWHYRLGKRVLPILVQYMRLYALGMFTFGALLLYDTFSMYLH